MIFQDTFLLLYFTILALIIGAVAGSFLNCAAWRIAHHESFLKGRSHCPSCGHVLRAADLVPVFSWLLLKGKCRYCKTKVPARYEIAELVMAAAAVAVLYRFDLSWRCLQMFLLTCILFLLSLVDLEIYEIPDGCHIAGILNWLIFLPLIHKEAIGSAFLGGLLGGLAIGGGILFISLLMDKLLGKESLGGGDVKLLFVLGLYLGVVPGLFTLILACVLGLFTVVLKKESRIPFGPSIAVAAWCMLLFGQGFVSWYLALLG